MLLNTQRHRARRTLPPALLTLLAAALLFAFAAAPHALAQKAAPKTTAAANKTPVAAAADDDKNDPPYHEYKGVSIGMTADEARKKLGDPADKGDAQDFYSFSESESAQVVYDAQKKVQAIAVYYTGNAKAPTGVSVFGTEVEAKPDGSAYRKVDYPKAGFWVAYSRTPGDSPLVTVMMQKKQ